MSQKILAVIPARYASSRFPGKPLVEINGISMIRRVYEQVVQVQAIDQVVVATDDQRIFEHVANFGGHVAMTNADHPSGTDRCAEVALQFPDATHIINVQGDEPFIQPEQIDLLIHALLSATDGTGIATLVKPITDIAQLTNVNIVKAVLSRRQEAIYFSRQPIPMYRGAEMSTWLSVHTYYKHIGLYGFSRPTLLALARLSPTPLERAESLEQLRWLEHGYRIAVGITTLETIGVDTPEDLLRF